MVVNEDARFLGARGVL